MPKVNDLKAYYRDIAAKAGLSEDEQKQALALMDNDKFARAFSDGFKPLPDYSHDLDDVRTKAKADKDAEYQDWFAKEQQKYNEFVKGLDELDWYRKTYPRNGSEDPNGKGTLTQNDIDKLVDAKLATVLNETLSRRDSAVLDLLDVREFHMGKFKQPLDVKAFEAAWKEHPEWGGSLRQAYKSFVEPEVQKANEAEWKAKADARYEEGVRDGFTRRQIPTDHQPKIFSPLYDRKEDVSKMTDNEQDRHSRESFFEGLREGNKQST